MLCGGNGNGHSGLDDGCVHNVKFTCGKDVQVVIKRCSPEVLVRQYKSYIFLLANKWKPSEAALVPILA